MIITSKINTIKDRYPLDKRAITGIDVVVDKFTVPVQVDPTVFVRTNEVPLNLIPVPGYSAPFDFIVVTLANAPFTRYEMISSGLPVSGQFLVDEDTYRFGFIGLSESDAGKELSIQYYGKGSLVFASDINELADGELLRDGCIKPRHIYQGITGTTGAVDFEFSRDVMIGATLNVGGNLNLSGDLNITGVINKSVAEVINITDDVILLNSGQGMGSSGPNVGLEVDRGVTGLSNPMILWNEGATGSWNFSGTDGTSILSISDNKNVEISRGLLKPAIFTADPSPVTVDMIPGMFYNSTDRQTKQIVPDGLGGAKIVIMA